MHITSLNTARQLFKRWPVSAVITAAAISLSACGGDNDNGQVDSTGEVVKNGQFDPKIFGAWRVLGEGRILEISKDGMAQFQETNALCYADRLGQPVDSMQGFSYKHTYKHTTEPGRVKLELYAVPKAPSTYTLAQLAQVPVNCRAKPPSDAAATFKTMWDIFDLDYGFFKERNIDWAARYVALAPKAALATDDLALQAVLVEAIRGFNDEHVAVARFDGAQPVFYAEASGTPTLTMLKQAYGAQHEVDSYGEFESAWRANMQASIQARLSGGSHGRVLNGAMVWGQLAGNIGYIGISKMAEFSDNANTATDLAAIRAEMDRAIAGLANTKAIIVDVAVNDGGYDLVSAEIAGSFADQRRPAFTVRQRRPQGRAPSEWFIEPKGGVQYKRPVYLLTTDRTVSAGDTLALMMRELPNVTHVGQPSSGSMSNKLVKSLPGNFMVSLSNESYVDPRGNLYEGRGIPPKLALPVFVPGDPASLFGGYDAALDRLIALANR